MANFFDNSERKDLAHHVTVMDTVLKHACVYVMSNETQTASLLLYLELTHCTREATLVAQ